MTVHLIEAPPLASDARERSNINHVAKTYDGVNNNGRFRYTGQVWLPEVGLFYYKARMYSPTLGLLACGHPPDARARLFMQTDPIGYADGMNAYAYVGNDPVNAVDPTGLATCKDKDGTSIICAIGRREIYYVKRPGITIPHPQLGVIGVGVHAGGGLRVEVRVRKRPQSEDVCAILANTPGDNIFVHGGGRVGLGFVPGAENVVTIEDNGRVSVTSTADFGAGIAGQASALAVGMNGDVRPDGTTSAGSHFDWDIQLGVSVKDIFSSGVSAAFSKGGGGLKFGATLRYVLETQTTTRTIHDFNCN